MKYSEPVSQLLFLDLPEEDDDVIDYQTLGITIDNANELIQMATDVELLRSDDEKQEFWGAFHAWRALGQLQYVEAIPKLLNLFDIFEDEFELSLFFGEEFSKVFRLMGISAIPVFMNYINTDKTPSESKLLAMEYIGMLGNSCRDESIRFLNDFLRSVNSELSELAGFAVGALLDLKSVESIDIIRDAYDRQCVDWEINGDIEEIEIDLGLRERPYIPSLLFRPQQEDLVEVEPIRPTQEFLSIRTEPKVGRNDPCLCGSGKKFKKCCLN
jgi:hypothetical protein